MTVVLIVAAVLNAALVALVLAMSYWALGLIVLGVLALWCLGSYFFYARLVLKFTGARPPHPEEAARIGPMVARVASCTGIPSPRVMIVDDEAANAFAVGLRPEDAVVAFSVNLLSLLRDEELEGVAAHEISHIAGGDTSRSIYVAGLLGWAVFISIVMTSVSIGLAVGALHSVGSGGNREDSSSFLAGCFLTLFLATIALMVFVATQIWVAIGRAADLAISRQREWLADARAAELTGNPLGLAYALEKLSEADVVLAHGHRTAQALCIAGDPPTRKWWRDLFSTHPPIEERIRRLYSYAARS